MANSLFTSKIKSISFFDHAVSAFGQSAISASVKSHSWGDVLIIEDGDFKAVYDIHNENGNVTFIAA